MENKISPSTLAAMVALATGQPGDLCEKFINELLSLVSDSLAAGENVRIKGLGTFKLVEIESRKSVDVASGEDIEIPAHRRIIFVPCKEVAALVNAPFEAFEAEEVADDLPTDELMLDPDAEEEDEYQDGDEALVEEESDSEESEMAESVANVSFATSDLATDLNLSDVNEQTKEAPTPDEVAAEEYVKEDYDETPINEEPIVITFSSPQESEAQGDGSSEPTEVNADHKESKSGFGKGFMVGFLTAAVVAAVLILLGFNLGYITPNNSKIHIEAEDVILAEEESSHKSFPVMATDSVAVAQDSAGPADSTDVPTRPSDEPTPAPSVEEPKYDTVSTTRFLTTMAQEHYGNYNLWPVIYMENQAILGHPDRIKPGTRVVVPPLSKYHINPSNPEDVAAMKREGVKIYAKFKKKI